MKAFNTITDRSNPEKPEYKVIFTTDEPAAYEKMQAAARQIIDEKKENSDALLPHEVYDIMAGVSRLYDDYKANPILWGLRRLARQNGKSMLAYRFIRNYSWLIAAYEKALKEHEKSVKKYEKSIKKQKAAAAKQCGLKVGQCVYDELLDAAPCKCWHCGEPILLKRDRVTHHVDGDARRKVYVHQKCHLKMHETTVKIDDAEEEANT